MDSDELSSHGSKAEVVVDSVTVRFWLEESAGAKVREDERYPAAINRSALVAEFDGEMNVLKTFGNGAVVPASAELQRIVEAWYRGFKAGGNG